MIFGNLSGETPSSSKLRDWLIATRPQSLTITLVPVMVGTALAWNEAAQVHWLAVAVALLAGLLIHAATNLHNDGADSELGNDGPDHHGLPSCVATGVFTARQAKRVAAGLFGLSAVAGIYLIAVGGWPILALGVLSILSGLGYTGGPRPIAYTPLGELFVIAFFGVGAVCGTCWLAVGHLPAAAPVCGLAVGAFGAAVLLVNNHRDIECDTRVGRRTLSIVLGTRGGHIIYGVLMALPFVLLPTMSALAPHGTVWFAAAALPAALLLYWRFLLEPQPNRLNGILAMTAQTQLAYGVLLCVGLVGL